MKCWHCHTGDMIWGADHDIEDSETYDFESHFTCNNDDCRAAAVFYHRKDPQSDE